MAGDGVTMIKVGMHFCVEFDLSSVLKPQRNVAVVSDPLDNPNLSVSNAKLLLRRGELNPFTDREVAFRRLVDGHARQPLGIVADMVSIRRQNCEKILVCINGSDPAIASGLDAQL